MPLFPDFRKKSHRLDVPIVYGVCSTSYQERTQQQSVCQARYKLLQPSKIEPQPLQQIQKKKEDAPVEKHVSGPVRISISLKNTEQLSVTLKHTKEGGTIFTVKEIPLNIRISPQSNINIQANETPNGFKYNIAVGKESQMKAHDEKPVLHLRSTTCRKSSRKCQMRKKTI